MSRTQTKSLTPAQRQVDAWNKQFGDRCAVRVCSMDGKFRDTRTCGPARWDRNGAYVLVEVLHPIFDRVVNKAECRLPNVTPIDRIPADQPKYVLGQTGVIGGAK